MRLGPGAASERNASAGFEALGAGASLRVGDGARSAGNMDGYLALEGGELKAGAVCVAADNRHSGFRAEDAGSLLEAGPHCRADGNGERVG